LGPEYGAQFGDQSIVEAYRFRPPYPVGVVEILAGLMVDSLGKILDAGCGSGDLAIPLLRIAEQIDAVDPSAAMLAAGRARPGGDDPRIRWIAGYMEDVVIDPPYALVTTGESLHWMDWPIVIRRFRELLAPGAHLAIVGRDEESNDWAEDLLRLINQYSTNRDYQPYNVISELEQRGLFRVIGSRRTEPVRFTQSVGDYIESIHSRNGFSRDRMTSDSAAEFDRAARELLTPYAPGDIVTLRVAGSVVWGEPIA
ncbi:MAG TPA: class I SAM-dependent methyltransferase, partial [Nitrolancea sp.]|nr:class I SAM-dependent methyltransferase [Nitrolancea sp.]